MYLGELNKLYFLSDSNEGSSDQCVYRFFHRYYVQGRLSSFYSSLLFYMKIFLFSEIPALSPSRCQEVSHLIAFQAFRNNLQRMIARRLIYDFVIAAFHIEHVTNAIFV